MAESRTIARPYAVAAFELAKEQELISRVGDELELVAVVAADTTAALFLFNPQIEQGNKVELFEKIATEPLTTISLNLLRIMTKNGRLAVLGEVAKIYQEMRAIAERKVEAEVISAVELTEVVRQMIVEALESRLGSSVTLNCRVDESLLGGTIIRTGDRVIDGSIAGKLQRMTHSLLR
ncbi:F0F1 ATP synthase subunit delta [Ectothiorhodospiraceae bacterium BW-2]|nr:F0F1 ATP synthase subunit delta [Ectothiorhodospiraceae bacterium BW-2]